MKVYQLSLMGFSEVEIASSLGIDQSAVSRYLHTVQGQRAWNSEKKSLREKYARLVQESYDSLMLTVKEAWRLFLKNETKPEFQLRALGQIQAGYQALTQFLPNPGELELERQLDELNAGMDAMRPKIEKIVEEQRMTSRVLPFSQRPPLPPPPQ